MRHHIRRSLELRNRRTDEQGFALIAVLAIISLFSLLIVAVLSQTTVATNLTFTQKAYVRSNRAAEGAIEAATNELLLQEVGDLENQDDACAPLQVGGDPYEVEVDGKTVDVYCAEPPAVDGGDFETLIPAEPGEVGRTVLLGASDTTGRLPTNGLAKWSTTCATTTPRANADTRSFQAGCFPWGDALDALWAPTGYGSSFMQSNVINALHPTLAHSAPEPLEFGGDVDVRGNVAATLNPAGLTGPAINVAGEYRQGRDGATNIAYGPSSADCRYLSPTWGTRAGASAWVQRQPDAAVNDVSGDPACAVADVAALRDVGTGTTNVALPPPAPWPTSAFNSGGSTVPTTCPAPTTFLNPGWYSAANMVQLNALIEGCSNTIVFNAGDYWFGGDLVIDNPNAKLVWGTPDWNTAGNVPVDSFPEEFCDPEANGVSITLRDNATITHRDGRVAICNRTSGIDTAIYQAPTAPSEWIPSLASVAKVPESNAETGDWTGIGGKGGSWSTAPTTGNVGSTGSGAAAWGNSCSTSWIFIVNCNAKAGVTFTLGTGAPSPDLALDSMTVKMVADSSDLLSGWDFLGSAHINLGNSIAGGDVAGVRIRARKPGGAWCTRSYQGVPNWGSGSAVPLAYDVLAPSDITSEQAQVDSCWKPTFVTQGDLESAQVRVDFLFRARYVDLNPFNIGSDRNVTLSVDHLQVQAGWPLNATHATDGAAGVLVRDAGSISRSVRCGFTSCPSSDLGFSVWDFSGSDATHLPASGVPDRVFVEVTGRNRQASDPNNAYTRATVKVPGKGQCQVQVGHIPTFGQTFQLEVLRPGGAGPCAGVITDPLDVVTATVEVNIHLDCYSPALARGCFRALGLGVGSISANIDHVRLVGFTAPEIDADPMRITMNSTTTGSGANFHVDGDISLTRRNLEVEWAGPAQAAPIVRGDLILNGLASVARNGGAQVGTVCCTETRSTARQVVLTAVIGEVDPEVVSRSVVSISDVDSGGIIDPGRALTVEEFAICRSDMIDPDPPNAQLTAPFDPSKVARIDCRTNIRNVPPTP